MNKFRQHDFKPGFVFKTRYSLYLILEVCEKEDTYKCAFFNLDRDSLRKDECNWKFNHYPLSHLKQSLLESNSDKFYTIITNSEDIKE